LGHAHPGQREEERLTGEGERGGERGRKARGRRARGRRGRGKAGGRGEKGKQKTCKRHAKDMQTHNTYQLP